MAGQVPRSCWARLFPSHGLPEAVGAGDSRTDAKWLITGASATGTQPLLEQSVSYKYQEEYRLGRK